jgi:hypothetical protein
MDIMWLAIKSSIRMQNIFRKDEIKTYKVLSDSSLSLRIKLKFLKI